MTTANTSAQPRPPKPIDTRGPRFGAGVTFFLGVGALVTGLINPIEPDAAGRILSPEFILLFVAWLAFTIGTFGGINANPWGLVFRYLVRPNLKKPAETEDPRPPHFALAVGFALTTVGLVLHIVGVPYGLVVLSALVVIASFLNAFVGYCLGCQVYLLLVRGGLIKPETPIAA